MNTALLNELKVAYEIYQKAEKRSEIINSADEMARYIAHCLSKIPNGEENEFVAELKRGYKVYDEANSTIDILLSADEMANSIECVLKKSSVA